MTDVTMRADTRQLAGAKADLTNLLGVWINAKRKTDHIRKIEVSEKDGQLVIRTYGMPQEETDELIDWGEAVATPYAASGTTEPAGFFARYEMGAVTTDIAANEKLGVLVLQTYTSFHDDSGRMNHYSREFFHHPPSEALAPFVHGSLAGRWRTTYPATDWIKEFVLTDNRDGTGTLRLTSANEPYDWGEVPISTYRDNLDKPGFHAVYDLGAFEALLAGNSNQGLVIIAAFIRFKGSDRANFLCREFYYRA